jgi:Mor family transcriptional regulator
VGIQTFVAFLCLVTGPVIDAAILWRAPFSAGYSVKPFMPFRRQRAFMFMASIWTSQHEEGMSVQVSMGAELFDILKDCVRRGLAPLGIAEEVVTQAAEECAAEVRQALGGVAVYIPSGMKELHDRRNRQMWAEFNGSNFFELSRKYEVSEMRVRQIIAGFKADHRKGRK